VSLFGLFSCLSAQLKRLFQGWMTGEPAGWLQVSCEKFPAWDTTRIIL
jgi:hypothetical protein